MSENADYDDGYEDAEDAERQRAFDELDQKSKKLLADISELQSKERRRLSTGFRKRIRGLTCQYASFEISPSQYLFDASAIMDEAQRPITPQPVRHDPLSYGRAVKYVAKLDPGEEISVNAMVEIVSFPPDPDGPNDEENKRPQVSRRTINRWLERDEFWLDVEVRQERRQIYDNASELARGAAEQRRKAMRAEWSVGLEEVINASLENGTD